MSEDSNVPHRIESTGAVNGEKGMGEKARR